MPALQDLYDTIYSYLGKWASPVSERTSLSPMDLQRYERASENWQQYTDQYIAIGTGGLVIAHGTLEETLKGIPKKESPLPIVFYVSPDLFRKDVRYVGV